MIDDIAIKVDQVSKNFRLPHEKATSLKSGIIHAFRKKDRRVEIQRALKNVSFEVKKGEFFGIVGRNGSGKSTLLKLIAGIYQPTKGSIRISGRLVPFIELGVGFNPELTGRENVYLNGALMGFSKNEVKRKYEDIVEFAELRRFMDQKLKNYSSGMQVRLAFSVATILAESDILLVDEVLAVGDADFQRKCFEYFRGLKKNKKTVIFVSHDMNAVREYCDRAILLEKSKVIAQGSSFDVANEYARLFLHETSSGGRQSSKERWGTNEVTYKKVSMSVKSIGEDSSFIEITTEATAKTDLQKAILGFRVRAEGDELILGTNSHLQEKEIENVKKGDNIKITWRFPNMLNTGRYYVDVAAQSDHYEKTFDSWNGATSFTVQRRTDNSYPVHPKIEMLLEDGE